MFLITLCKSASRLMAMLGGIVLTALILLTCVSVLGRSGNTIFHMAWVEALAPGLAKSILDAGLGPVPGDFELVEAGMAFTIFAFLPLCQVSGAHASVDIFTASLSDRANRLLIAIWDVLFAVVLIVIAWKLYDGMTGKMRYNETTFMLQFPVWWAYAVSLAAAVVAAVVGVAVAVIRLQELVQGRVLLAVGGAEH